MNSSPVSFVESSGRLCTVFFEPSKLFPVRDDKTVEVTKVQGNAVKGFRIHLRAPTGARGVVRLRPPPGERLEGSDIDSLLYLVFERSADEPAPIMFIGNTASEILHVRSCNHLPALPNRQPFGSIKDGERAGFVRCSICFIEQPAVFDLSTEALLGRAMEARIRASYQASSDQVLQTRANAIGEQVLSNWPQSLRGYSYRFTVIEDAAPNAFACPLGAIFLTSGLMKAIESEAELEAAVAHEIAHVEMRHGYRQYRSRINAARAAAFITVLAGVVTYSATGDAGWAAVASEVAELIVRTASELVILGHSREHESESDAIAAIYLMKQSSSHETGSFVTLLNKLKYNRLASGSTMETAELLATHPTLDQRVSKVSSARVGTFGETAVWEGVDKNGEVILTLTLETEALFDYLLYPEPVTQYVSDWSIAAPTERKDVALAKPERVSEYRLIASVRGSSSLTDPLTISQLDLISGRRAQILNGDKSDIFPGEVVSLSFSSKNINSLQAVNVTGIQTPFTGKVVQWQKLK